MDCRNCSRALEPGTRFCPACGTASPERACTACGAALPADASFCPACGMPAPTTDAAIGAAPARERKMATMLFAD
ncbi:MAG: zinc ribbon domain-containing protein, partial [Chloroflexota bacterium]